MGQWVGLSRRHGVLRGLLRRASTSEHGLLCECVLWQLRRRCDAHDGLISESARRGLHRLLLRLGSLLVKLRGVLRLLLGVVLRRGLRRLLVVLRRVLRRLILRLLSLSWRTASAEHRVFQRTPLHCRLRVSSSAEHRLLERGLSRCWWLCRGGCATEHRLLKLRCRVRGCWRLRCRRCRLCGRSRRFEGRRLRRTTHPEHGPSERTYRSTGARSRLTRRDAQHCVLERAL